MDHFDKGVPEERGGEEPSKKRPRTPSATPGNAENHDHQFRTHCIIVKEGKCVFQEIWNFAVQYSEGRRRMVITSAVGLVNIKEIRNGGFPNKVMNFEEGMDLTLRTLIGSFENPRSTTFFSILEAPNKELIFGTVPAPMIAKSDVEVNITCFIPEK